MRKKRKRRLNKEYLYRRWGLVLFVALLIIIPIRLHAKKAANLRAQQTTPPLHKLQKQLDTIRKMEQARRPAEEEQQTKPQGNRVAYLTFDDGPNDSVTMQILDILDREQIKGTFFVVGKKVDQYPEVLQYIHRRGHAIGNHSYSHEYQKIYASTEAFMADFSECEQAMKRALGEGFHTSIMRFPGGSFEDYKQPIAVHLNEMGYHFYDWNALNGDGESNAYTTEEMVNKLKATAEGKDTLIVLMHDSQLKEKTVESLPEIISWLRDEGYTFKTLLEVGQ